MGLFGIFIGTMIGNKKDLELINLIDPVDKLIFDLVDEENEPVSMSYIFERTKNKLSLSTNEINCAIANLTLNQILILDHNFILSVKQKYKRIRET